MRFMPEATKRAKYSLLLGALLANALLNPFLPLQTREKTDGVSVCVVLVAGLYLIAERRRRFFIGLALALPAVAIRWLPQAHASATPFVLTLVFTGLFLGFTAAVILIDVLTLKSITFDAISASVCSYMLLGLAWAMVYALLELSLPGSFYFPLYGHLTLSGSTMLKRSHLEHFVFYSFETLTTTGFGDIVPAMQPARALSALEAMVGVFYLAIVIARLVSLQATQAAEERIRGQSYDSGE